MAEFAWTDDVVATATRMHAEGFSRGDIARTVGTSRNAVCGKLHRLGLRGDTVAAPPPKPKPARARPEPTVPRLVRVHEPEPEPFAPPVAAPASGKPVSFVDLRPGQCRFIPGQPDGVRTLYCGDPAARGEPYCAAHRAVCWQGKDANGDPKPRLVMSAARSSSSRRAA